MRIDAMILDTSPLLALALGGRPAAPAPEPGSPATGARTPVGVWRSADGTVRLDIRTDGTYAGTVAGRKRAVRGTYRVDGATMTLRDDSGLRTPVTVRAGALEMAGHRLGLAVR